MIEALPFVLPKNCGFRPFLKQLSSHTTNVNAVTVVSSQEVKVTLTQTEVSLSGVLIVTVELEVVC